MSQNPPIQCDVLIVGGGPAGSSCAWRLRSAGLKVIILDKAIFPRDKTCAGWITPSIIKELNISTEDYSRNNILQPITGFRTGVIGTSSTIQTNYDEIVSYGIRRCEFDQYLLQRTEADLQLGTPVKSLESGNGHQIVNGQIQTRLLVGAGGHFCPVARKMNPKNENRNEIIQAQEVEFLITAKQKGGCGILANIPELYFCSDMQGYGWCFRKGDYLNIGMGREGERHLNDHISKFMDYLHQTSRIDFDLPYPFKGHAYRLYGRAKRQIVANGMMLIGDALGLASPQSGEGIRPAIESGLMAAEVILQADGNYKEEKMIAYAEWIQKRFGRPQRNSAGNYIPSVVRSALAKCLLNTKTFTRHVLLDRWFLHTTQPALNLQRMPSRKTALNENSPYK
jgi:geranylgeranyl reductase family protein